MARDLQFLTINWYEVAVGVIIVISASVAIIYITKGSRNKFAYAIMLLSELLGIYYIGY